MNDEAVHGAVKDLQQHDRVPRQMVPLDEEEALQLLGSAPFGRVVFTRHALPAIRPVNHVVVDGSIVIRTHEGAALTNTVTGEPGVVAYEADAIDPVSRLGWSVVVTGYAHLVSAPATADGYRSLLTPWVEGSMDRVVRISPDLVTGFRLVRAQH
ncbi:pyridoxamine 5'-phosphate oxidase family protein [Streptomyces kaniharaensis]|uniref:Pyridoxamine 5'-phosphate oxidase family protein n=1 Tax=Streptomyces kaniharaensis TaxID=212423 RepID=A0A6N7L2U7_9ACTN|nr:pyridoxamine 5'-phosphate oxidase family protein [Streptomyces kaniharaensis]MQS17067.1 pyridoxamine 5'-phosphate oxidase family protein [Streptomyces kaniharaensis]